MLKRIGTIKYCHWVLELILFCILFLFFLPLHVQAATYYVDPAGDDTNPGTSALPFKTIQKAADVVQANDTVLVRPGIYKENVEINASGASGTPIVFQGQAGAIVDPGDVFSGWEPAPEVGSGVYKISGLPYVPDYMAWNNKHVVGVNENLMADGTGFMHLARDSSDSWWDGVEALYGSLNGVTYVRFRNGQDPDDEDVRFTPRRGTGMRLRGSHITLRGFTIRNAWIAVDIIGDYATDNVVEENTFIGGSVTVYVRLGPARNHIRRNKITLDYIYPDFGHPLKRSELDQHIWVVIKSLSADRTGISVLNAGADNQIYENEIVRHFDGIAHVVVPWDPAKRDEYSEMNRGLKIYKNLIHHIHDSGIEIFDGGVDVEWHDNLIYEATSNMRFKHIAKGPMYIYRNRVYDETQISWEPPVPSSNGLFVNLYTDPDTPAQVYFYHNSFATGGSFMDIGTNPDLDPTFGMANFWFLNNALSSRGFWIDKAGEGGDFYGIMKAHFDYNWVGGEYPAKDLSTWPETQHNIMAEFETLWDRSQPSFLLDATSSAKEAGIDLSNNFTVDGVTLPPLPGMETGYFAGSAPDVGAVQFIPAPTIVSPSDGSLVTDSAVLVQGTAFTDLSIGLAEVQVRLNGGAWQKANGIDSWETSLSLTEGVNTIEARSLDQWGNFSAIESIGLTLNSGAGLPSQLVGDARSETAIRFRQDLGSGWDGVANRLAVKVEFHGPSSNASLIADVWRLPNRTTQECYPSGCQMGRIAFGPDSLVDGVPTVYEGPIQVFGPDGGNLVGPGSITFVPDEEYALNLYCRGPYATCEIYGNALDAFPGGGLFVSDVSGAVRSSAALADAFFSFIFD